MLIFFNHIYLLSCESVNNCNDDSSENCRNMFAIKRIVICIKFITTSLITFGVCVCLCVEHPPWCRDLNSYKRNGQTPRWHLHVYFVLYGLKVSRSLGKIAPLNKIFYGDIPMQPLKPLHKGEPGLRDTN